MKIFNTILFVLLTPLLLLAQLSPGKLSRPHAELEGIKNCSQCHERKQQISAGRCLTCHKLLKERIDANKGMHADENHKECQTCHVEHQGEDYALIWWPDGKDGFDHNDTGYELKGKHRALKCEQCHSSKFIMEKTRLIEPKKDLAKTFLGLSQECLTCHKDEHRAQMENCTTCHTMEEWKPAEKFAHTSARYQLIGRHQTVACVKCHPVVRDNKWLDNPDYNKFKDLTFGACTDCHADPHNNRFGPTCEKCHTPNGWSSVKTAAFDHSRTRFPLLGRHQEITCRQCHITGQSIKITKFDQCRDCHLDYHRGQFTDRAQGGACEECHTVEGFSPSKFTLVQHQKTDFQLEDSHLAVPCNACHVKSKAGTLHETMKFQFSSTRCVDCHRDPHQNTVDKFLEKDGCEHCHNVSSWSSLSFDHKETGFDLLGRHIEIRCSSCHQTKVADNPATQLALTKLPTNCEDCHADIHYGQFRDKKMETEKGFTRCDRCHTPTDWLAEKFDHNRDSEFKIEGAHQYVKCEQCHLEVTLKGKTLRLFKLPRTECSYCHDAR